MGRDVFELDRQRVWFGDAGGACCSALERILRRGIDCTRSGRSEVLAAVEFLSIARVGGELFRLLTVEE